MALSTRKPSTLGVVRPRRKDREFGAQPRNAVQAFAGFLAQAAGDHAPALDQGLITPYSVLTDMPVFNNNGKAWPRNENRTYAGQTTIMQAVADSTNTIAVNVMDKLTPQSAYNFLTQKLGFTSLSKMILTMRRWRWAA